MKKNIQIEKINSLLGEDYRRIDNNKFVMLKLSRKRFVKVYDVINKELERLKKKKNKEKDKYKITVMNQVRMELMNKAIHKGWRRIR